MKNTHPKIGRALVEELQHEPAYQNIKAFKPTTQLAMVQGFISPLDGLSAWSLMFKQWFGDFDKNCDIVDARYQPLIRAYFTAQQQAEDAKKNSSHFSWGAFVMTLLVFFVYAVDSTKRTL